MPLSARESCIRAVNAAAARLFYKLVDVEASAKFALSARHDDGFDI